MTIIYKSKETGFCWVIASSCLSMTLHCSLLMIYIACHFLGIQKSPQLNQSVSTVFSNYTGHSNPPKFNCKYPPFNQCLKTQVFWKQCLKLSHWAKFPEEWVQMSIKIDYRESWVGHSAAPESLKAYCHSFFPSGILEYQSPDQHKEVCFQKEKGGKFKTADYRRKLVTRQIFSKKLINVPHLQKG